MGAFTTFFIVSTGCPIPNTYKVSHSKFSSLERSTTFCVESFCKRYCSLTTSSILFLHPTQQNRNIILSKITIFFISLSSSNYSAMELPARISLNSLIFLLKIYIVDFLDLREFSLSLPYALCERKIFIRSGREQISSCKFINIEF